MNKKEEKCLKKALKISGNFISLRASARATPYDSNFLFSRCLLFNDRSSTDWRRKKVFAIECENTTTAATTKKNEKQQNRKQRHFEMILQTKNQIAIFLRLLFLSPFLLIFTPARKIFFDVLSRRLIEKLNHKYF